MKSLRIISSVALATVAASAFAHHGWSGYDAASVKKLSGTIQESSYENPHGMAHVKTAEGTWKVVLAPVSRMESRGLTREMLKAGTTVTVEGYPHKEHADELRAERITVADTTVELR